LRAGIDTRNKMLVATVLVASTLLLKLVSFVNQPAMATALATVLCSIATAFCYRFLAEQSSSSNRKIKKLLEVLNIDLFIWLFLVVSLSSKTYFQVVKKDCVEQHSHSASIVEKHGCVSL
jgi:hypothetical protein